MSEERRYMVELTASQVKEVVSRICDWTTADEARLALLRKLAEPLPAWILEAPDGRISLTTQGVGAFTVAFQCACGEGFQAVVDGRPFAERWPRCTSCGSRCVAEAQDPSWPKWAWNLYYADAPADRRMPIGLYPRDRVEKRFSTWFAESRRVEMNIFAHSFRPVSVVGGPRGPLLTGHSGAFCGTRYNSKAKTEGPPVWFVTYFEGPETIVTVDLHWTGRKPSENGICEGRNLIDLEAGKELERITLEEIARGVVENP